MSDDQRKAETQARLGRVLGPAGPELSCEECFEHLDRFVELEVAGRDAEAGVPGMTAHLRGCPACAEDRRSLRDLVETGDAGPPEISG